MTSRTKRLKALESEATWRQGETSESDIPRFRRFQKKVERWSRQGLFDTEPDFPKALELTREALNSGDLDRSAENLDLIEEDPKIEESVRSVFWLLEIVQRVLGGVPPVTEAEFKELSNWFLEYQKELWKPANRRKSKSLDLGNGRKTTAESIRERINKGYRAPGAGMLAIELRRLRGW